MQVLFLTDEYDVTAIYRYVSDTGSVGIGGRCSTSAATYYYAYFLSGQWVLVKSDAGSLTTLGTFATTLTAGTSYTVKLEIRNAAKKLYIDGVERISSTDNTITAAGRVAMRSAGAVTTSTGKHIWEVSGNDLIAPSLNVSDSDTVSISEAYSALRAAILNDPDTISETHGFTMSSTNTRFADTGKLHAHGDDFILGTDQLGQGQLGYSNPSFSVLTMITRTDTDTISAAEARSLAASMVLSDVWTIGYLEERSIITNNPPIRNDDFAEGLRMQSSMIHDIARRFAGEEVIIMYYHAGIFDTQPSEQSHLLPDFITDLDLLLAPDSATNFLITTHQYTPLLVGTALSYWDVGYTNVTVSRNIDLYAELTNKFGINTELMVG